MAPLTGAVRSVSLSNLLALDEPQGPFKSGTVLGRTVTRRGLVASRSETGNRMPPTRLRHLAGQYGRKFGHTSRKTIPQALDSSGFLDVSR
jgi:hypothetical protein